MAKTIGRFHIDIRAKILDEYVLYVEDLHVSFRDANVKKELKKELKTLKKEINHIKDDRTQEIHISDVLKRIVEIEDLLYSKSDKLSLAKLEKRFKSSNEETQKDLLKEIEDLRLKIKNNDPTIHEVLKGVTFGLRKGETLAIVGANGAGKTVMLETILGINLPDSYSKMILNLGRKHYANNLKLVGIQYQQAKMTTNITVRRMIDDYKRLYSERIDEALIEEMLDVFHIRPFYTTKVTELSGGQKQRLNLLLALINKPKIMILDEFITGLDVNSVEEIINYVNGMKLKLNSSMIIVSHQPEEIEELADRVIVMKDGKIILETYVEDIINDYGDVTQFIREII